MQCNFWCLRIHTREDFSGMERQWQRGHIRVLAPGRQITHCLAITFSCSVAAFPLSLLCSKYFNECHRKLPKEITGLMPGHSLSASTEAHFGTIRRFLPQPCKRGNVTRWPLYQEVLHIPCLEKGCQKWMWKVITEQKNAIERSDITLHLESISRKNIFITVWNFRF